MKRLAAISILSFLCACGSASPPRAEAPPSAPAAAPNPADRIARVERGLLPVVQVRGEPVTWTIEARMREHRVPGLSIAVFADHRLQWAKAYGVADVDTGARVTETTLFQAGSISKPVTAMAALMAVERGAISLDAPINTALSTWKLPDNDLTHAAPVTLRRLLSHTAGTTVHGFLGYAAGEPLPTLVQVLDGAPPANTPPVRVDLAPGTKFRYSGGGTTIAQLALIDRLGKPFPAIMAESVLGPLGMDHSTYEQPLPPARVIFAASGHDIEGNVIEGKRHVYPEMAAAGLWTTPSDLARFFAEIDLAREGRSTRVSKQIASEMTTAVNDAEGGEEVALGLFLSSRNGARFYGHNGADMGFQAYATARLGKGYGAILMANSNNGFKIFEEVARAIAAEYGWEGQDPPIDPVAIEPAKLAAMAGRYATDAAHPFTIAPKGARLELRRPFADPTDLVPVSGDTFVALNDGSRYKIDPVAHEIVRSRRGDDEQRARPIAAGALVPILDLDAGRYDEALAGYQKIRATDPKSPALDERELNQLGFEQLLRGRELGKAIAILRINVTLYPDSMNTYDSLGEAYARAGDKVKAIATFQAGLAAMARDKTTPEKFKDVLRKNAEKQIAKLQAK